MCLRLSQAWLNQIYSVEIPEKEEMVMFWNLPCLILPWVSSSSPFLSWTQGQDLPYPFLP